MKFRAAALVASAGMAVMAGVAPASAATNLVVTGTAHLPQFPCKVNPCSGGTFSGKVAVAKGPTNFKGDTMTASYSYTEACAAPGVPLSGTANGSFSLNGANSASGNFSWVRTGLTANLVLSSISVNGGPATHSGTAVAAFEPVGNGLCPPGKSGTINAQVQIVATIN